MSVPDGGAIVADDDKEAEADDRPEDCGCLDTNQELPCFPCYWEGYDTPNPLANGEA